MWSGDWKREEANVSRDGVGWHVFCVSMYTALRDTHVHVLCLKLRLRIKMFAEYWFSRSPEICICNRRAALLFVV